MAERIVQFVNLKQEIYRTGSKLRILGFEPHQRAIFAVMHSDVLPQRRGNVRPLSPRRGAHEATRVHIAARRCGSRVPPRGARAAARRSTTRRLAIAAVGHRSRAQHRRGDEALIGKRLELLKHASPGISRVGVRRSTGGRSCIRVWPTTALSALRPCCAFSAFLWARFGAAQAERTLQLSTCCSSLALPPSRSFAVRVGWTWLASPLARGGVAPSAANATSRRSVKATRADRSTQHHLRQITHRRDELVSFYLIEVHQRPKFRKPRLIHEALALAARGARARPPIAVPSRDGSIGR
jgi:hypothetical protein